MTHRPGANRHEENEKPLARIKKAGMNKAPKEWPVLIRRRLAGFEVAGNKRTVARKVRERDPRPSQSAKRIASSRLSFQAKAHHGVACGGALVEAQIKSVELNGNMVDGIPKPSLVAAR